MLMVFVGTNHYPFRLRAVTYDDSIICGKEFFGIKVFRQLESRVCGTCLFQTVKPINFNFITVVAAKHIPSVFKQFHTIWFDCERIAVRSFERTV